MLSRLKSSINTFVLGTKEMITDIKKKRIKKQLANILSWQRILIPFLLLCTLANPVLSLFLTAIGGLSDLFDGYLARKLNTHSKYGKLLDQMTDKFFSSSLAIILMIQNPIFIPIISLELSISMINIYYKNKNPKISDDSSLIGKFKQFPLFITLSLGFISHLSTLLTILTNALAIITTLCQSATLINYTKTKYEELQKLEHNSKVVEKERKKNDENESNQKTKILSYHRTSMYTKNKYKVKKRL